MADHKPDVIYRWDLDKTYLQTEFSTIRGLLQAAVEGAHRKQAIPGVRALLRGLSQSHETRVVVVSGSPEWIRGRLEKMFKLHGIRCDRLVLKDFGAALKRGRISTIKSQVPYKLLAHLETRLWLQSRGEAVPEICFGDDAEVDALIYCLYSDVCTGRIGGPRLARILKTCGAYDDEIASVLGRLPLLGRDDPVRRIFIHLAGNSPPARFGAYRGRVLATFNALQIAVNLADAQLCDDGVVIAVAESLVKESRVDAQDLAGSLEDAVRRGLCRPAYAIHVAHTLLPRSAAFAVGFTKPFAARVVERLSANPGEPLRAVLEPLPYEQLFEAEQAFAQARKLARQTANRIPGLAEFLSSPQDD